MAVARLELGLQEVEDLIEKIGKVPRGSDLFRAKRELTRALERGREAERREQANMVRIRAARRVPDWNETPLIPQSMSRRER